MKFAVGVNRVHWPGSHKELLGHDGTRTSQPAKPSPNMDNAGHHLMGLQVTGIEPGSLVTRLALQCLRPLRQTRKVE